MIYLYLLVLLVSLVGLGVVVMEWSRGVRDGLIGAFSTFLVALLVAAGALVWLYTLDGVRPTGLAPTDGVIQSEGAELQEDSMRPGRTSVERELRAEQHGAVRGFRWRSIFTPDFIAGVLLTAFFTVLAQIQTTLTIGRLHRSIETLQRRLR